MLFHRNEKNLASGNLFTEILFFAIPLFLSSVVQNLFTAADAAIVGNFADSVAVASIGASTPVIKLLIDCFISFATGAGIIVARSIGAKDTHKAKLAVDTALVFSVFLGVFLMLGSFALSVSALKAMNCPQECFDGAVIYMNIYMLGTPAFIVYNFAAAIIRAEGDSTRPLVYLFITGIIKVLANILLCLLLPNKVVAVAIATVISQTVSAVLVMYRLFTKKDGICRFSLRGIQFQWAVLGELFRYGVPLSLAAAIYPIANLQIQPAINSYGADNLAGVTSANNIDTVTTALQTAFNATCVTFMSQSIGAHNRKRVEQSMLICGVCSFVSGLIIGLSTTYVFSDTLLGLFLPDNPQAVFYGQKKMQYTTAFYWLSSLIGSSGSMLQAFGYPAVATFNNLVSVLGFRIVWMNFVYNKAPSVDMLYVCYTISWAITCVINLGVLVYAYRRYRKKEALYQAEHLQIP